MIRAISSNEKYTVEVELGACVIDNFSHKHDIMKLTVFISFLFLFQARASFLDEITGAIASVENALGKLLNDVVADVKNTVHCTIVAMEQVLVVSGAVVDPSLDNEECYDRTSSANDNKLDNYESPSANKIRNDVNNDIDKQISSSISKVNETLVNIFDNDGHDRLKDIKKVLQNETDRLTKVSILLRQELEKISYRLKDEIRDRTSNKSSLQSLWDEIEILRDVEMNDKNTSEVNEIGQVLNEAIDVMNLNTTNDVKSDEDKIKIIMTELENESHNYNVTFDNIKGELSEGNSNLPEVQKSSAYDVSQDVSKQFKKEAAKLLQDNNGKELLDYSTVDLANRIHEKTSEDSQVRGHATGDVNNNSLKTLHEELSEYKNFNTEQSLLPYLAKNDLSTGASENFKKDASNIFETMNTTNVEDYTTDKPDDRLPAGSNSFEKSQDEENASQEFFNDNLQNDQSELSASKEDQSELQDPSDYNISPDASESTESESINTSYNMNSQHIEYYSTEVISTEKLDEDEYPSDDNIDSLETIAEQNTSGYDISQEASQTFKNDATRMLRSKDGYSKEDDYISDEQVKRNAERNVSYDEYQTEEDASKDYSLMDPEYSSSFHRRLTEEEHKQAIEQAKDIVSDSTHTDSVLAMIYSDTKRNSELVNFE